MKLHENECFSIKFTGIENWLFVKFTPSFVQSKTLAHERVRKMDNHVINGQPSNIEKLAIV